jgi:hypothetical protein
MSSLDFFFGGMIKWDVLFDLMFREERERDAMLIDL